MKLKELQRHILMLATVPPTADPVISCYLNREADRPNSRCLLEGRLWRLKGNLGPNWQCAFEEALNRMNAYLDQGVHDGVAGLAIFARPGQQPFFPPPQFHVLLSNWLAVDTAPNIYQLAELKDAYHCYTFLYCTKAGVGILGLNVGTIIDDIWKREWKSVCE